MAETFRQRWDHKPNTVLIPAADIDKPYPVGRWLVVCPQCDGCARLQCWRLRPDVITCTHCGLAGESKKKVELWLRVPCCGHTLWAVSRQHLRLMEDYISAGLRERLYLNRPDREYLATLPTWMVLAKNRAAVLRGLTTLRERLIGV